ncbi:unnamed protein product [Linum trigynum]|uniref:Protein LNK2 n=1 Tax=Linum trigynum TaxID=586398 RepID=A0AAV2F8D4_9ROSI
MFDWNDEELTNIIWDEDDRDNHTVPNPEASEAYSRKMEWTHEASNSKQEEQKAPATEVAIHGRKLESTSNINNGEGTSASGYHMDPWPGISVARASKTNQGSLETSGSSLSEITKFDSSGGVEAADPDKDPEIYRNPDESEGQAGFVDYSWADIGSFDDLDQIFSNDDSIFGNVHLGNSDEMWSSSKEVSSSPEKSFPLSTESPSFKVVVPGGTSEHYGARTGYAQQEEQQVALGYARASDQTCSAAQSEHAVGKSAEYGGGDNNVTVNEQTDLIGQGRNPAVNSQLTVESSVMPMFLADKVHKQKKNLKGRKKMMQRSELDSCPTAYHNWNTSGTPSGQFKDVLAPSIVQSSAPVLKQQSQQGEPESIQYQQMQISSPFVASSGYGNVNIANPCSSMPLLSHAQSLEFKHQSLLPGYDVSPNQSSINNLNGTAVKSKMMTSQEKIEKLRRRQQMRAILAIQKQQQQFVNHQASCRDHQINKRAWEETQVQQSSGDMEGVEDPSGLSTFELGSPPEQDDSRMVSLSVKDYETEESTLHQLQDIIAKLDVTIRLCIRDSLFRLAQSATQRHSLNDTRCTNISCKDELGVKQQAASGHDRNTMIPEEETKTNPIDRIVAHLLFHRPRELPGKLCDTPESPPVSSKPPQERQGVSEQLGSFLSETPRDEHQNFSGSKTSCLSADPNLTGCQAQNVTSSGSSENASNSGQADKVSRGVDCGSLDMSKHSALPMEP